MANQAAFSNNFGVRTEEEVEVFKEKILTEEFSRMGVFQALDVQQAEKEQIQTIFRDALAPLTEVFRYYCGYGSGSSVDDMSLFEFRHFISNCKVFEQSDNELEILEQVFRHANKCMDHSL